MTKKYAFIILPVFILTLLILTVPFSFGFAFVGDSSRHIANLVRGVDFLKCYYLSFYALSFALMRLGIPYEAMLGIYPVLTYGLYVLGFAILARTITEVPKKQLAIVLLAMVPIWGLFLIEIQPFMFGLSLVPFLLVCLLKKKMALSILLYLAVALSHPLNALMLLCLLPLGWYYGGLLVPVAAYYLQIPRIQLFAEEIITYFPPAVYHYPHFSLILLIILPFCMIILLGIIAMILRGWHHRLMLPLLLSIILGCIGISGIYLVREPVRLFAWSIIFCTVFIGLYYQQAYFYGILTFCGFIAYYYLFVRMLEIKAAYGG